MKNPQPRNIGIPVPLPTISSTPAVQDKKCPFTGDVSVRGRGFVGHVVSTDTHRSATIEWERRTKVPKYERYEKRRTRVRAHNPALLDAKIGDKVMVMECRPLSKTKRAVIVQILGRDQSMAEKLEARELERKAQALRKQKREASDSLDSKDTKKEKPSTTGGKDA